MDDQRAVIKKLKKRMQRLAAVGRKSNDGSKLGTRRSRVG
jgi:hypothetical protein